jgi:hypothetical protein
MAKDFIGDLGSVVRFRYLLHVLILQSLNVFGRQAHGYSRHRAVDLFGDGKMSAYLLII